MQRRRQWQADLAREAPQLPSHALEPDEDEEEEADLPQSSGNAMQISSQPELPEEEVDDFLQHEDAELEALLSYMPRAEDDTRSEHLYSDDDDYDALFSEFIEQQEEDTVMGGQQSQQPVVPSQEENEAMDTS